MVNATAAPITLGGYKVYSASFDAGDGYRIDNTTGVATGNEEETLYMVTSGQRYNDRCCFE
jgi:non-reducing end alpha-L-arabinofuranosidase